MLGYLEGVVLTSDGQELILKISTGVGYVVYYPHTVIPGTPLKLFIFHSFKENGQDLFGFSTLREKKLFKLLLSVKGVGPKSAYSLITSLTVEQLINAIKLDQKKFLQKAPGIGAKAASQIILDLQSKTQLLEDILVLKAGKPQTPTVVFEEHVQESFIPVIDLTQDKTFMVKEALMACQELGLKEERVLGLVQDILSTRPISSSEQLLEMILKEM